MKNQEQRKEKWKGFFEYTPDLSNMDLVTVVEFITEVTITNNSFNGFHHDVESHPYFQEKGKVKGFFEEDFINFTLEYPCLYFINENGNIEIDKNQKHPLVNYLGYKNSNDNLYSGKWEIETNLESYDDRDVVDVQSGIWKLTEITKL